MVGTWWIRSTIQTNRQNTTLIRSFTSTTSLARSLCRFKQFKRTGMSWFRYSWFSAQPDVCIESTSQFGSNLHHRQRLQTSTLGGFLEHSGTTIIIIAFSIMSWKFFEIGAEQYLIASNTVAPGNTGCSYSCSQVLVLHNCTWNNTVSIGCFDRSAPQMLPGRLNLTLISRYFPDTHETSPENMMFGLVRLLPLVFFHFPLNM